MIKFLIKIFLYLHSFSYQVLTILVPFSEDNRLHPKHRIMNYHQFFLENINEGDTVLDVGCGNGALTYDIAKKARNVIGMDISRKNIQKAQKKYRRYNLEYIQSDVTSWQHPYNLFISDYRTDVIVLSNVLEHIDRRIELLQKLKLIAPKLLIRVPLVNRDWITLYKKEIGIDYRLDRTHFIEYTPESFEKEMNEAGLKVVSFSIQFGELWSVVK